jgi:predicted DNA-binding protein (UPF0251 family)
VFAGPPRKQTAFRAPASRGRTLPPGGQASFFSFAGAVVTTASALFGAFPPTAAGCVFVRYSPLYRGDEILDVKMSSLTMTEPLQVRGISRRLSDKQPIPSGVMQAVLMHALQLRPSCREVFLLCDIQRHSIAEAAAILGISRNAAKRRLDLARRRMDEVIERLCGENAAPPS